MRYRKLSPTGDYTFGSGALNFYQDTPEAVGQAVQTRLRLFLGEWFLNIDEGTYFFQGILGKKTKASMDATIQDRILGTQGVVNFENYVSVIDEQTRIASVTFDLNTIYGQTTVQIANYVNY